MATDGDNPNGDLRTGSAASSAYYIRTSGAYLQGASLDDDLQGHWLWRMCLEALLVFGSAENEEEFEASWSEPALLVQPLLIYHSLWYIDFIQHKSVDGVFANKGQIGCGAIFLCVPILTVAACFSERTSHWVRHRYHTIIGMNVFLVMAFNAAMGVWDQFYLSQDFLCPTKFYACPHHAMDSQMITVTWISVAYINIFSSCLVKFKAGINVVIVFIFIVGALVGDAANLLVGGAKTVAVHVIAATTVIALGTFFVGYVWEHSFRQSLKTCASLQEGTDAISDLLAKVLPLRLLEGKMKVPLLEHFEGTVVLFCSFRKDAIDAFDEVSFFNHVNMIYAIFDEIVEKSGCFKIEHVGEDYVVVADNVRQGKLKEESEDERHEMVVQMSILALDLVEAGSAFVTSQNMRVGYSFGFRAGLHYGPMSAGILGRSRRFYRIFGDTVVTAARMCQHTDYGTVQVSEKMNEILKDSRPKRLPGKPVNTKGKGWLNAYLLAASIEEYPHSRRVYKFAQNPLTSSLVVSKAGSSSATSGSYMRHKKKGAFKFRRAAKVAGVLSLPTFPTHGDRNRDDLGGVDVSTRMQSTTAGGADATVHSTLRHSGSATRGDLVNALYGSSNPAAEGVGNVETSGGGTQRRGSKYFQQVNSKLRADCQSTSMKSSSACDPEGGAVDGNDVHSGLHIVPALFRIDGLFQDAGIETEFRMQYAEDLAAKSIHFLAISRGMSIILFSSVASLGQTVGWDTPSGLTGNRIGGSLNFSDVFLSSWLWVSLLILSFATIFIPPAFLTLHKWWGPQLMCACQSFFFGLMTLVSMASLPSVLSLGIPLAYISQVAAAPMDVVLASASTIPIVVLCYVEAFNSGKLVTNASVWFYLVCLFATLLLILAHHVWNQIEVRKIWKSQNELYEEKRILETILLDMLPPEYAGKIVRSIDIGGKTQKAVVLFSDLQGYSKLNERLSPHDIAMVMHGLWCVFDALVQKHGMHKMDTVGDAFIVTGLVDDNDENLTQQASAMVDLAREMIVALKDISMAVASGNQWWEYVDGTKKFHEASIFTPDGETNPPHVRESDADLLKIRIGIDTGEVVAGVIGKLQPRFHAHGAVMAHAQKLEAACISGSVLISPEMARILQIRATPDQDAKKGFQIPFPVVEHFFPPTQESIEVDPSSSIAGTSCLGIFLRVTGFALPEVDQKVRRRRKREGKAERQEMLAKRSLQVLQGLRKFSRSKIDWKAGSIVRSKAVNVHVDQTVLEPKDKMSAPVMFHAPLMPPAKKDLADLAEDEEELASGTQSSERDIRDVSTSSVKEASLGHAIPVPLTSAATLGDMNGNQNDQNIYHAAEASNAAGKLSKAPSADVDAAAHAKTVEDVGAADDARDVEGTLKAEAAAAAEIQDLNATLSAVVESTVNGHAGTEVGGDDPLVVTAELVHLEPIENGEVIREGKLPGGDC